jgi:hypothetical protein
MNKKFASLYPTHPKYSVSQIKSKMPFQCTQREESCAHRYIHQIKCRGRENYQTVHVAPMKHATSAKPTTANCLVQRSSHPAQTPFAEGGNVVAKAMVGFGAPLTVTVAADPSGEGCDPLTAALAARMVNREEVEYIIPCVELRKRRK